MLLPVNSGAKLSMRSLSHAARNAEDAGVDPTRFYTTRTLAKAFLAACDKDRMESFAPLFTGSSTCLLYTSRCV